MSLPIPTFFAVACGFARCFGIRDRLFPNFGRWEACRLSEFAATVCGAHQPMEWEGATSTATPASVAAPPGAQRERLLRTRRLSDVAATKPRTFKRQRPAPAAAQVVPFGWATPSCRSPIPRSVARDLQTRPVTTRLRVVALPVSRPLWHLYTKVRAPRAPRGRTASTRKIVLRNYSFLRLACQYAYTHKPNTHPKRASIATHNTFVNRGASPCQNQIPAAKKLPTALTMKRIDNSRGNSRRLNNVWRPAPSRETPNTRLSTPPRILVIVLPPARYWPLWHDPYRCSKHQRTTYASARNSDRSCNEFRKISLNNSDRSSKTTVA